MRCNMWIVGGGAIRSHSIPVATLQELVLIWNMWIVFHVNLSLKEPKLKDLVAVQEFNL